MHQPFYRQPGSDVAILPWVRLHAVKDYLHMAQVLERHPQMSVTFTLTPSLVEQLQDYVEEKLVDRLMILAGQEFFSPDDRQYLLNMGFSINWDGIIRSYPPYEAILNRRHLALLNPDYFSTQTYRDLLVWFNLAWTDPNLLESDPFLAGLVQKGQNFTIDEAQRLMQKHLHIMAQVLPTYQRLARAGQLELTTVPYYHPILPLLVDSRIAQRPSPGLPIPQPPFQAPEDAQAQLQWAVNKHIATIGQAPAGLWPSEGAVAPEIMPLVAAAGLTWLATDEAILGQSLDIFFQRDERGLVQRGDLLYHPWRYATPQGEIAILFRDHELSDRIGFVYQHMPADQAASDLIARLEEIVRAFGQQEDGLITIILDGENAWEYYEHNGDLFLDELYQRLTDHPQLHPVTPSQHLAQHPPRATIEHLASGSWIMGDFTTWMGDPEHTVAWAWLRDLRQTYEQWRQEADPLPEQLRQVQRYLFAAEGSDWFWWYSHRNSSEQDALFDALFREYLAAAYRAMDLQPPANLARPIFEMAQQPSSASDRISPQLTASPDPHIHWAGARVLGPQASTGAMQQAGGIIQAVRYGNDEEMLYLRVELAAPADQFTILLHITTSQGHFLVELDRQAHKALLWRQQEGDLTQIGEAPSARAQRVAEFAIPLAQLGLKPDTETDVTLRLVVQRDNSKNTKPDMKEKIHIIPPFQN